MNVINKTGSYRSSHRLSVPVWQYLVLFLVLVSLSINALPNLFLPSSKLTIPITQQIDRFKLQNDLSNELVKLDATNLQRWLSAKQLYVDKISISQNGIIIENSDLENLSATAAALKSVFGNEYQFKLTSSSNLPDWLSQLGAEPLKLGLDLSGGVLFVLNVDLELALEKRMDLLRSTIVSTLIEQKQSSALVKLVKPTSSSEPAAQRFAVLVRAKETIDSKRLVTSIKKDYPNVTVKYTEHGGLNFFYNELALRDFDNETMAQSITTLRSRIEHLGITEAATQRQGTHRVRVELPGVNDPAEAKRIIGATASLAFYKVQQKGNKRFKLLSGESISVNDIPIFTGDNIRNARVGFDEMGIPLVNLTLDSIGGQKMLKYSSNNIGQQMLTVLTDYITDEHGEKIENHKVISNATIQAQLGSRFSITNLESRNQAKELALLLRAGSLNAPIEIEKQQTIGATLGKENIANGFLALVIGVTITLLFMMVWYRKLGLIANLALVFNMSCLIGLMSLLPGVVLTLPGIAGLVLTVGMAVDTNVIIFERIKEERRRGLNLHQAIELGYQNATATIMDANLTTLITAMVLYSIGYGAVKGFAITLGLGIVTSMFTGIFFSSVLTKTLYLNSELKKERSTRKQNQLKTQLGELNHER